MPWLKECDNFQDSAAGAQSAGPTRGGGHGCVVGVTEVGFDDVILY